MQQVFKLTGDALLGLVTSAAQAQEVVNLSDEVRLGANLSTVRPVALRLEQFVDLGSVPIPATMDWYTKAAPSIARMYLNNRYGCCVISGKGHAIGVWSANDPDSAGGQVILATDQEISDQYFGVCGRGDNGCNIPHVLNYMVQTGFQAGGKRYKLRGYCAFDWRSKELTQIAIAMGGALCIGFNLPGSWMNSAIWDTSNAGRIVGGHDVTPLGYGPMPNTNDVLPPNVRAAYVVAAGAEGVIISSWGRLYLFTWAAWQSRNYITECYFMLPEFLWTGTDKQTPFPNVNLDSLIKAMDIMKGGGIPPLPELPPPVDPTPDPPPVSGTNIQLPGGGALVADFNTKLITYPAGWTARQV